VIRVCCGVYIHMYVCVCVVMVVGTKCRVPSLPVINPLIALTTIHLRLLPPFVLQIQWWVLYGMCMCGVCGCYWLISMPQPHGCVCL
jgi:hypothetical protein